MGRAWRLYWGWPRWAKITIAVIVVLFIVGIANSGSKKNAAATTAATTTQRAATSTTSAKQKAAEKRQEAAARAKAAKAAAVAQAQAAKAKAAAEAKKPSFVLIVSQSSCQESPSTAYVNCSIGVKNKGGTAGLPTVYVYYRYSDSGTSYDSSKDAVDRGGHPSDPIPPHELGFVYFSHPYKATDHDLLQAAASLNENAKKMPYVRVASPDDVNWPSG